ncbi:non-ribosomal peptide synthetase [Actinosynnema sp. ALI-1.44]|uniref:hybrid non-ribosomal peptide synthetase/type I polyketide synthase n=1 Tax=Actinosynnema sp. ALI-1.44 TaxID=1933779 RepID=UPI00097C743D|nr:hybrid non-ribosomal peptide synthetase/type I polyketide synthase [Actinosynnema sp. ALI-1.44]ONI89581.1 non-ribosomal peptide synthetase [Actinosynnema sp. ALI-1.44]
MTWLSGPDLILTEDDPRDVVGALRRAAESHPDAGVMVVADGVRRLITYPQLLAQACRILTGLRAHGVRQGDHVVLSGLALADFFPALWACVLGGITPAAVADPADEGGPAMERLRHTWRLLGEPLVIANAVPASFASSAVVTVASCLRYEPAVEFADVDDDDVVVLMLSSGSTGQPKAAQLTQRALVRFAASTRRLLDVRPGDVSLNWLPLDHSGAFLLSHLVEVFAGCTNVHAPTSYVLADPTRWLDLIAEHRANHSWAPMFAYQLVADAVTDQTWDLSCVRTLLCGGEQIMLPVLDRFMDAVGVGPGCIVPAWGMAETTTAITYGRLADPHAVHRVRKSSLGGELLYADDDTPEHDVSTFVAVGPPAHETRLRVVDDRGVVLPDRHIGRLHISSPRVTPGYLNDPAATAAAFSEPDWLDTGDLAFLSDGQLVITGRHKDVIVLKGHNHFAHEIEQVAATAPGVRPGEVAACGVPDERSGTEQLAIFFVGGDDDNRTAQAIRRVLHQRLRLTAAHVVAVAELPRTPSGKVQRAKLRDRLVVDTLGVVAESVAAVLGMPVARNKPFYEAGLDSVLLVRLRDRLERELGREIAQTALFEHPTVEALTAYLDAVAVAAAPRPAEPPQDTRIAVIGMALRFPGARSVDEFWANLRAGVDSVSVFGTDDPDRVPVMGVLEDVDAFDAEFFGMNGREAAVTDPAQRLFLEVCYHALEDAGHAGTSEVAGVFAGSGSNLYGQQARAAVTGDSAAAMQAVIGQAPDFLATRVAYRLGLTGPAIGVQTACSTSLVAVHLAVQSLLAGEVDMALAGAAAVHLPQQSGYRRGAPLSPTGRCRPFDAEADGTVGGNGVAAVVLKRLDRAIADGDTVHAVLLGSAVNNDGASKAGFSAPGVAGQVDVIRRALTRSGVRADSISYVEAHGTGTELGDPIEFEALTRAFRADTERSGFCALGSVKANVGHLDSCAGMAGLIKTVLMLRHGELVATLNLSRPNPGLRLDDSPFVLATRLNDWTTEGPRRAGVSALGVGGTNAHVILEEPPRRRTSPPSPVPTIAPLSARDPEALADLVDQFRSVRAAPADIAATLALGRAHFACRAVAIGGGGFVVREASKPLTRTLFAFSGQGSARYGMARELYDVFPVVRDVLDECDHVYGGGLLDLLLNDRAEAVWPTLTAQPALFAFEVALARLWESFGITPDAVTGHSLGEYAALCVGGAITMADGMRLTGERARLMADSEPGGMVAVHADIAVAQKIADATGTVLAAVNGSEAHVLAGTPDAVRRVLDRADVRTTRLALDRAFHTALMDDALAQFRDYAKTVPLNPLRVRFVSSLDGRERPVGWLPDPDYLVRQARQPVRFDLVMSAVDGSDVIEVGPGEVLTGLGDGWLPSQRAGVDRVTALWLTLGELYVRGADINWAAVIRGGSRISLPVYPFKRTRFPVEEAEQTPDVVPSQGRLRSVRAVVARVLGAEESAVTADKSFFDFGADSLTLMSLARAVDAEFGAKVPVRTLFADADTPRKLASLIGTEPEIVDVPDEPETVSRPASVVQETVDRQLRLGERLVDLMERQLAMLTTSSVELPPQNTATVAVRERDPEPVVLSAPPEPVVPDERATQSGGVSCDFSLYFFGDYPEQQETNKYELINAATEFADRHGFHSVWLPERHFHSFGALFPNPSVLAAALAARTRRIKLQAGSVVLPLHNPIRVAEEWSVVDNLSGGRVGLCFASGWHAGDFALAPQNFGKHRELMYEQLDTVRRLWSGEAIEATSGSGEPIDVRLYPRPIQQRPPMFVAVVSNPDSYRRAAEEDLGVVTNLMVQTVDQLAENIALYRRTRREHGLDPAAGRVVVLVHTHVGPDAITEAYQPFCAYLRSSLSLFDQVTNSLGFDIDLANTPEEDVDFLLDQAYRRYCESRALIGAEQDVAAVADRLIAAGVNEIACFVDFGVPTRNVIEALPAVDRLRERYSTPRLPLSPGQRRVWLMEQLHPDTSAYHEPKAIRFTGRLDERKLIAALQAAVHRQPELRTVFREQDGEPHRVVLPAVEFDCPVLDYTGTDETTALRSVLSTVGREIFDLAEGPLVLARLLRLDDEHHLLFLLAHHIVFDSSSTAVLVRDMAAHYSGGTLPTVDIRVTPEHSRSAKEADLEFWQRELADAPVLRLPTDRPRPVARHAEGASFTHEFKFTRELARFCASHRVTPFMAMLGAVAAALGRFSGQDDVVIGTAVTNRPPDAQGEVGLFLDTVALRMDLSGDPAFADLVSQVRDRTIAAYEHRHVAFDELVRALNPTRDASRNPLFQVMVEFENAEEVEFAAPLTVDLLDVPSDRAPFDITFYLTQHRAGLRCSVEYDTRLFDEVTVRRVLDLVEAVLRRAMARPDAVLSELVTLTEHDRAALNSWQGAPVAVPSEGLHHLVERQAADTPDAVALLGQDIEVSYRDLDKHANRVARRLHERGIGPGDFVAVLLPRGAEQITAMLGVLKAGAAYLPIDVDTPKARREYMMADCAVALLLTTEVLSEWGSADDLDSAPPAVTTTPDSPAYCIYTSGSTGRPKGVVVPHRGPVNLVRWQLRHHRALRTLQWTSTAFDVSVQEIFTTLAAGATLVLITEDMRHDVPAVVAKYDVQRLFLPFTPLKYLVESLPSLPSLREIFSAGEALSVTPALRRFLAEHPSCALYNQYGPTETTIIVTSQLVDHESESRPPIGAPIDGVELLLLDSGGREVPVGAVGEIHIAGIAVAQGYVRSPFNGVYRTGDLGRWRADGTVEFVGRIDDQVKIRGHRVEPGEVQAVLQELDGVVDAAVVARPDVHGEPELVAYVVSGRGDLADELAEWLPGHAIPRRWVQLDRLPYNTSGKLDRDRLPAPTYGRARNDDTPADDLERSLHAAWCAELGRESVPVNASFFELGGHSLTAIRLVNRIAAEHRLKLSITDFFHAPTIRAVAARRQTELPMTSFLRRLWQRHHERVDPAVYNIAHRVDVEGPLDLTALTQAFTELVRRHDALRMRLSDDTIQVLAQVPVELPVTDLDPDDVERWCREQVGEVFVLTEAPLFRFRLARISDARWVLVVVWHHSVCDAWSLDILWREIGELYRGTQLRPPRAQFAEYVRCERSNLAPPRRAELEAFWRKELDGARLRLALPVDHPRPGRLSGRGARHEFVAGAPVAQGVRRRAAEFGSTPYMVLAGAFAAWISDLCGQPDIVLAASSANRLQGDHDEIVGPLGDAVLLRVRPDGGFPDVVARMAETVYTALDHQALPLTEVARLVAPSEADGLFPTVLFTVVTTPAPTFGLPGATLRELSHPGMARNELYAVIIPSDDTIRVVFEYSTDLFEESTILAWGESFLAVLAERCTPQ